MKFVSRVELVDNVLERDDAVWEMPVAMPVPMPGEVHVEGLSIKTVWLDLGSTFSNLRQH